MQPMRRRAAAALAWCSSSSSGRHSCSIRRWLQRACMGSAATAAAPQAWWALLMAAVAATTAAAAARTAAAAAPRLQQQQVLLLVGRCYMLVLLLGRGPGCGWWCLQGLQLAGALRQATRLKRCADVCARVSVCVNLQVQQPRLWVQVEVRAGAFVRLHVQACGQLCVHALRLWRLAA